MCLRKTIKNPPRYGCRESSDVDRRNRLMHGEANQSDPNYHVERSGIDHSDHGSGLGDPDAVRGDPYVDPWVS
jgi:hypothetical protein